jgi:hypothetical protein
MEFVEQLRRSRRRRAAAEMRPQKYEGAVIFGSMLNTKARCEATFWIFRSSVFKLPSTFSKIANVELNLNTKMSRLPFVRVLEHFK